MNSKLIFILKFRNKNTYFLTNGTIQKKKRKEEFQLSLLWMR
jgi:hypothetical protein